MLYDRTCRGGRSPGLSHAWAAAARCITRSAASMAGMARRAWAEGLDWLLDASRDRPIAEIQFWGHGEWGGAWIEEELLTSTALSAGPLHARSTRR